MPFSPMQFRQLSAGDVNPFSGIGQGITSGIGLAQKLQQQQLANALSQIKMKYAPQDMQSQINLRNSQAGINKFQLQNPMYMNTDAYLISLANQQQPGMGNNVPQGNKQIPPVGSQYNNSLNQNNNQQTSESPNYNFGVQQPTNPFHTGNPVADNLLYKKFGNTSQQQFQNDISKYQTQENLKSYSKDLENANEGAQASLQANTYLDEFLGAYKDLGYFQKGPLLGRGIVLSDAASKANTALANLIPQTIKSWQQNHVTNMDIELQERAKPSIRLNEDAVENLSDIIYTTNRRAQEYQPFLTAALNMRIPNSVANELFNLYNQQRPQYNAKDSIRNMHYQGTWKDYLTPEAVDAVMNGKKFTPKNQKELSKNVITDADISKTALEEHKSTKEVRKLLRMRGLI